VIAALKDTGDYDDVMCDRFRTVLLAPHKHKGRGAIKAKQTGTADHSLNCHYYSLFLRLHPYDVYDNSVK